MNLEGYTFLWLFMTPSHIAWLEFNCCAMIFLNMYLCTVFIWYLPWLTPIAVSDYNWLHWYTSLGFPSQKWVSGKTFIFLHMNNRTWLNTFRSGMCCNNSDNAPTTFPPLADSIGGKSWNDGEKGEHDPGTQKPSKYLKGFWSRLFTAWNLYYKCSCYTIPKTCCHWSIIIQ